MSDDRTGDGEGEAPLTLTPKKPVKPKRAHRIGIVAPSLIVLVAFGIWSGYWFYVAHQVQQQLLAQQAALIKSGYQASIDPFSVSGYPYRMYLDLKGVTVIAPSGKGFTAPEVVAEANAYALTKWVINVPQGLTLFRGHPGGTDLGKIAVTGSTLKASVSHLGQPVENIALSATDLVLAPSDTTHPFIFSKADVFQAYTRQNATQADAADWLVRVDGAHGEPKSMVGDFSPKEPLTLRAEGTFSHVPAFKADSPAGWSAWAAAGGQMTGLHTVIKAGDLTVEATSPALSADQNARVSGHLQVAMTGTFKPIDVLTASRLISPENLTLAAPLLNMTLATSGTQKFDIDFKDGGSYMGFLKLSDAPSLP